MVKPLFKELQNHDPQDCKYRIYRIGNRIVIGMVNRSAKQYDGAGRFDDA
jgi:hypothetical protein